MRRFCLVSIIVAMLFGAVLFGAKYALADDEQLFTACNMWYEEPERMWSTLYQKGAILPAGTPVKDVEIKRKWTKQYIMFKNAENGMQHGMLWIPKHRPGVTIEQMMDRLFTPKDRAALTKDFSAKEKEAIKKGKVEVGMSKDAVLVCYGYPPEVETSTLESDQWKYWHDRFRTHMVNFTGDTVGSLQ